MKIDREAKAVSAALGFVAALTLSAPIALADPLQSEPVMPVASPAAPVEPAPAGPAPVAAATDPVIGTPAPPPAPDGPVQPVAVDPAAPPKPVPQLSSPENLPPGTTDTPLDSQGNGVSYLRDIWHAYQTQEVDGKGALLLLTQRPMNADAVPPPGMYANPTPPTAPLPLDAPPPPQAPPIP